MKKIRENIISYTIDKAIFGNFSILVDNGEVIVKAPWYFSKQRIQEAIKENKRWILKKLSEMEEVTLYNTTKILGVNYAIKVIYTNVKTPGLNLNNNYIEIKLPIKLKGKNNNKIIEIILNKMYIWLYNNATGKNVLRLPEDWKFNGIPNEEEEVRDKNTYIIKVAGNNGNARIDDYRYVSNYNTKIRKFTCKEYLKEEKTVLFETENIYALNLYTNNIWFAENEKNTRNYIKDSYYDYELKIAKSMLSNWKKEILKQYNHLFLELFEQEEYGNFMKELDKLAIEIIQNMYVDNVKQNKKYLDNSRKAFNLWQSYKKYFKESEESEMKINNLQEQCQKIVQEEGKIETDEQYYFLAGQVAYYLLNQSKAEKLTQDVTEPFIKANTVKKLKEEIEFLYKKYNYEIYLKYPKFNNVLSQLLLQEPEEKVKDNKDVLLAGLLANNLFYQSGNINNGGNENE